ncbi:ROK family transcriptional regulator [Nocardioides mangrovi]|uniref:ROK family protein n=1 Tax=Nocardioides mangrovi TaxID=2874580 RepID=A0ABS7UD99_9ACTN|nr:ROK family transcriptional regulator [Nocardioides mangrovi]MBZ5738971.1 ROK family protein [Nocardioides mangrovi]
MTTGATTTGARLAGTTEQLRRANLSRTLEVLHQRGPTSRSDLTRTLGLSRSTMAAVVADLEALGLVTETQPAATSRAGRPSGLVRPADDVVAIAVNPEVDAVHVGVVGLHGRVLEHTRIEVPDTRMSTIVPLATAAIRGMLADDPPRYRVVGIGLAIPGQVRISDGVIRQATHLGWTEEPIADLFVEATGLRTWAANAATLAMRAESQFGAGQGVQDLVYFIGGASGIGGGAIVGGRLLTGDGGYAGEFGHTVVRPDGRACHCGGTGCLEAEVDQATLLRAVGLEAAQADELPARLVASDDPAVADLVEEKSSLLAIAVRNALNTLNPEAVVLSGFLAALHRASGRDLTAGAVASARERVELRDAALGVEQLMIGAGELVFGELLRDPVLLATPVLA